MSDELEGLLGRDIVEEVIMTEGMKTITDLFEFFTQALDVAVDWISQVDDRGMDKPMIRAIISQNVSGKSLEEIIEKLSALTEVQEDL